MQELNIKDQLHKVLKNFIEINLNGKKIFISKNSYQKIINGKIDIYVKVELKSKNIHLKDLKDALKNNNDNH